MTASPAQVQHYTQEAEWARLLSAAKFALHTVDGPLGYLTPGNIKALRDAVSAFERGTELLPPIAAPNELGEIA